MSPQSDSKLNSPENQPKYPTIDENSLKIIRLIAVGEEANVYEVFATLPNGNIFTLIYKDFTVGRKFSNPEHHMELQKLANLADLPVPDYFSLVTRKGKVCGILMESFDTDLSLLVTTGRMNFLSIKLRELKVNNPRLLESIAGMKVDSQAIQQDILDKTLEKGILLKVPDALGWILPECNPIISDFGKMVINTKLNFKQLAIQNITSIKESVKGVMQTISLAKLILMEAES